MTTFKVQCRFCGVPYIERHFAQSSEADAFFDLKVEETALRLGFRSLPMCVRYSPDDNSIVEIEAKHDLEAVIWLRIDG